MIYLVIAAATFGAIYGRIPAAVAERVFREDRAPLLIRADFTRPLVVEHPSPQLALGTQVATAVLAGATAAIIGDRWVLVAYLWFVVLTVTLTLTDVARKLIPNGILFRGFAIAVALLAAGALADGDAGHLLRALVGAAAYFGFLLVLALLARGGFGMGDVKLAALLGAFLAYDARSALVVGAVGAFLVGGAFSLLLVVFRIKGRKDAIPFGPSMVAAAYIAIAAGTEIADWYGA